MLSCCWMYSIFLWLTPVNPLYCVHKTVNSWLILYCCKLFAFVCHVYDVYGNGCGNQFRPIISTTTIKDARGYSRQAALSFFPDDLKFAIALVEGGENDGRVEVSIGGKWGTICGLDLTRQEARVMCRELGYHDGREMEAGKFGPGSGDILLTGIKCEGRVL